MELYTYSVTQRIDKVKQPRGGYINPKSLSVRVLEDNQALIEQKQETVAPGIVGIAVDYLTRWQLGTPIEEAFHISFFGAEMVKQTSTAKHLAASITDLEDNSIIAACKLVGFDSAFRAGVQAFRPVEGINADIATCRNIRIMVHRGLTLFDEYGPVTKDGMTFAGGYTDTVSTGDGDFMTTDTVWDFKVSVKPPTSKHTLQVCMYWLLGLHSNEAANYETVKHLGFFNPRLNSVYTIAIDDIPSEVKHTIEVEVIGYKENEAIF